MNNVTDSPFLTGLVLSMTTMAGIFLNIPFGIIEGRMDMKKVLQTVLLAYSGLALLYPLANSFVLLLSLSVLRGIASSFLWLTSWAYVFFYSDKAVKGKETGFFSDMNDLASAVSPVLGGVVSLVSFFLPFYILCLASLVSFMIVSVFLKESPKPEKRPLRLQMTTLARHLKTSRFAKTVVLTVVFYALINIYYSFLSVFLNQEGISIPLIGIILTVALLPAVSLEVPMGNWVDSHGVRKGLTLATIAAAATGIMMPLSNNFIYVLATVTGFTVSYTMIFITLYSRMSDVIAQDKVTMTGAIATFKDLGYTIGPLAAGPLIELVSIKTTFLVAGGAFALLLPIALVLHD